MNVSAERARQVLAMLLAIAAFTVGAASPAGSAANDVFSIEPTSAPDGSQRPWFVYSLAPGQIFQDSVDVKNFSDDDLTLAIYPSDGLTIPGGGGFSPLREGDEPTGAGTWLTLPLTEITLGPLEGATIPFQIEIPLDATPGDHAAVIVASDPEGSVGESDGPIEIEVRNRVGARIYVRVAGPIEPSLSIEDITVEHDRPVNPFSDGTARVRYVVRNTGNIRLSEDITLEVKGLFGRHLQTLPTRTFPDVLPDGFIVVDEVVEGLSAWEPLTVEVTASSRETSTTRTKTFYPIPWPTVLLILLAIALFIAWIWVRRRNRQDTGGPGNDADGRTGPEPEPDPQPVGSAP